jgi:putative transposase
MAIKPNFVEGEIYHIYNRGVEKREIFMNEKDYYIFIHNLFEFNDKNPATNLNPQLVEVEPPQVGEETGIRRKKPNQRRVLVEILMFTLMKNHYHLLVRQKSEGGIVKFMQKLGTGYTMYFNKKYSRVGPLFQGAFKAKIVENDPYFLYLPHYIHLNPLIYKFPNWPNKEITDPDKAIDFLKNYRWSSFPDYAGVKNFPSVTQRDFLLDFFSGTDSYLKDLRDFISKRSVEVRPPQVGYGLSTKYE